MNFNRQKATGTTRYSLSFWILAVGLAYFVTGRFSMLLAVPPGYATAVWPAAGIALAAVLLRGPWLWPGIWLGSFAVNLSTATEINLAATLIPFCAATGAVLQALLGARLIRGSGVAPPLSLDEGKLIKVMLLGGPLACCINASFGAGALLYSGVISTDGFLVNWATWWVGDTIGVLVFAPVVLNLFEETEAYQGPRLSRVLPPLLMFTVIVALFLDVSKREQVRVQAQLESRADVVVEKLREELAGIQTVLNASVALFESHEQVSLPKFEEFARHLLNSSAPIRSLQWLTRVDPGELDAYTKTVQALGQPAFQVRELNQRGELQQAVESGDWRAVVTYTVPLVGNERALGYDIRSNPLANAALLASIENGAPAATVPISLVQETQQAKGVVVYAPVHRGDPHTGLPVGYASAVLRIPELVAPLLAYLDGLPMQVSIRDAALAGPSGELYVANTQHLSGEQRFVYQAGLLVADRVWNLRFVLDENYLLTHRSWQAWWVLVVGLLLTALLGLLFLMLSGRNLRVRNLVIARTAALTAANRELREREASMERLLAELRGSELKLQGVAKKLGDSNRELEQFASLASHDLKAPLRTISSFAQLLQRELGNQLEGRSAEYFDFIQRGVRSMHALTDDLLELSRINRAAMQLETVSFRAVVNDAKELLNADIEVTGCVIEVSDMPFVEGDSGLLRQLVQNLLANSIKFQRPGQAPRVVISCTGENDGWRIDFADNGIGIEEANRDKVFRIFSRLHAVEDYPGSGVGLAICQKVAQLHGGKIWVANSPGEGTVISLWLPGGADAAIS